MKKTIDLIQICLFYPFLYHFNLLCYIHDIDLFISSIIDSRTRTYDTVLGYVRTYVSTDPGVADT
jgi:hypothetical protein